MIAARKSKEHSTKISMKTMSILGKDERVSLPNKVCEDPTCYEQKTKLKHTKK